MKRRMEITADFLYDPDAGLLSSAELADNVALMLSECGCEEVTADAIVDSDDPNDA